jgi:hypothetical protein
MPLVGTLNLCLKTVELGLSIYIFIPLYHPNHHRSSLLCAQNTNKFLLMAMGRRAKWGQMLSMNTRRHEQKLILCSNDLIHRCKEFKKRPKKLSSHYILLSLFSLILIPPSLWVGNQTSQIFLVIITVY